MGEFLGIPEWLALILWVGGALATWLGVSSVLHRRGMRRLAEKRPCITEADFVAQLTPPIDARISEWLWRQALPYYGPMRPHPDDHMLHDAMIDDGDICLDWVDDFAQAMEMGSKRFPDWPNEWELTLRNYAAWLQLAVDRQAEPAA